MKPRILVTGAGAVCAAGMDADAILARVRAGESLIGPIEGFDTTGWPARMAAEVRDYNARALVDDRKLHKFIRRTDFFEILRKEHELAVKLLWQFLGVLADRLDATSSELRHAKEELSAEDITADIFDGDLSRERNPSPFSRS